MDRLAVWTYWELGEEIACGYPSVSDEQRSAAGRETLAHRSAGVMQANRRRARQRHDAGSDGGIGEEDAVRVWTPREERALRARLGQDGQDELAVWAEGEVLHVIWCGHADRVMLGGGVQPHLWRVEGTDDLWEVSLRIRRLDEAVISIIVFAERDDDQADRQMIASAQACWRGAAAPAAIRATSPLTGTITKETLHSAVLGTARGITVYRPPTNHPADRPLPICILADGESVPGFAAVLESAVLAGAAPAVLLVGIHSAADPRRKRADGRTREYVPGFDRRRFRMHLQFVSDEVLPHVSHRDAAAERPVVAAGFSSGAAWAIAAGQRRPDVFTAVAALSPGIVPARITRASRTIGVRHYLASGTLEPGFRRSTRAWADRLHRARMPYRHQEWNGGHDTEWWQQHLPTALQWLLDATSATQ